MRKCRPRLRVYQGRHRTQGHPQGSRVFSRSGTAKRGGGGGKACFCCCSPGSWRRQSIACHSEKSTKAAVLAHRFRFSMGGRSWHQPIGDPYRNTLQCSVQTLCQTLCHEGVPHSSTGAQKASMIQLQSLLKLRGPRQLQQTNAQAHTEGEGAKGDGGGQEGTACRHTNIQTPYDACTRRQQTESPFFCTPPPPQDKSSRGSVDTTKTHSAPQRVRMSSGERPIGATKGKQPNTKALCQPSPPTTNQIPPKSLHRHDQILHTLPTTVG